MSIRMRLGIIGVAVYLLIVFVFGSRSQEKALLNSRLEQINSSGPAPTGENHLRQSFAERIFKPLYKNTVNAIGTVLPVSGKAQSQLDEKLRKAGKKTTARDYLAKHTIFALLLAALVFFAAKLAVKLSGTMCVLAALYGVICYYVLAKFMLGKEITQRRDQIENDLPEILDLLSVSVSAGLGFDQALQYVTDRCVGPLAEELSMAQREIMLGRSRDDALKNLADRCEVEPLKVFVSAIIQADTLGIAIANVLQTQAENVRQMHKQKIEEKAAKLPVKILIPLVVCIFPVMFIILLGPAVPSVISAFAGM